MYFFFLAVEEKLVEDADVCITKCVSMIGVIIHSIVFHLKYSIILSSDINKQVNAAIDASCSAQVAVSAPLLYTSTLHLAKCKIGSWKFSFLHPPLSLSLSHSHQVGAELRNLHSVKPQQILDPAQLLQFQTRNVK